MAASTRVDWATDVKVPEAKMPPVSCWRDPSESRDTCSVLGVVATAWVSVGSSSPPDPHVLPSSLHGKIPGLCMCLRVRVCPRVHVCAHM